MTSRRLTIGLGIAAAVLVLDRLTKWWIVEDLDLMSRHSIELTSFFNLTMVWNQGVSFGLFGNAALSKYLIAAFAVIVSIALLVWMVRTSELLLTLALGFIVGGALGNASDRLIYGAVADFFDFHVAGWHFWAFNIADSAISIGVVLLLWDSVFGTGRQQTSS